MWLSQHCWQAPYLSLFGVCWMYYDPNKTLSRQRLFNFVVGARGIGKTYGAKKTVINNFIKKGKQFVYVRRYETELPAAEMRNFFDDIAGAFPEHEFKAGRGLFYIDNKVAGWYIPLSKATMLKSIPFPDVSLIIFDEFIIEVGMHRYLPNEVRSFLECYSTISRDRDVPVLFLSNAITMTNPYFIYFDVKLEEGQTVKLTEFISVEVLQSKEYEQHVAQTKFGRMIAGTEYGNYAMQNRFLLDNDKFIEELPSGANYICTIIIEGTELGYYVDPQSAYYYLSTKVDKQCTRRFALSTDEHDVNTELVAKSNFFIQEMINYFCMGALRFETVKVKNLAMTILRKII